MLCAALLVRYTMLRNAAHQQLAKGLSDMAHIYVKRGSEGPRHDPYSYTEVHFTSTDEKTEIVCHLGLAEWLKVNGKKIVEQPANVEAEFRLITGMRFDKAERIPEILEHRRRMRMAPKEREQYDMCVEADAAMRRYAE